MKKVLFFPLFLILVASNCYALNYTWSTLANFKGIEQFNLFLKGDLEYYRTDIQGRVAVEGNVKMKAFSIGLKSPQKDFNFIVGGTLEAGGPANNEGGQVENGGIFIGGDGYLERIGLPYGNIESKSNLTLKDMTVEQGDVRVAGDVNMDKAGIDSGIIEAGGDVSLKDLTVHGDVFAGGQVVLDNAVVDGVIKENPFFSPDINDPFDFSSVDLAYISDELKKPENGVVSGAGTGYVYLECSDPSVCYFNISASTLEQAGVFEISAPENSAVVINVEGNSNTDDDLILMDKDFRISNNMHPNQILYNFIGFSSIEMTHIGLLGSILAPNASINFYEGEMKGVLMAKNLRGGSWIYNIKGGQINLPEPSTIFMLACGLLLFFLNRKRNFFAFHNRFVNEQ